MFSARLVLFLLIASFSWSSAQVMNVRKWRKSERDSLDNGLLLIDEKYYSQAFPIFEALLSNHPQEHFLKYSYAKCAVTRSDKHADAFLQLSEVYLRNHKLPDIQYDMARLAHYNYRFDEALEYLEQYTSNRRTNEEGLANAARLKKHVENAKYFYSRPTGAKVINLGPTINSEWDEYVPAITADESMLIFTYAGQKSTGGRQNYYLQADIKSGIYMEDIFISTKANDIFTSPKGVSSLNTDGPDAAISLNTDGSVLYLYKDIDDGHGDIYQSFLSGDDFSPPEKLRGKVNSYSWDGHCSLSPDGNTLYFSSERPGGFGGRDIYRASLSDDSSWVNVVNLGDSVNSADDDDAPFIHPDGVTLYFSSKGHNSMGGYDVFRAVMNPSDSTFSKIRNLGYPINTPSDDIFFVMSANGENGYYSSGRKEGRGMKDIYLIKPDQSISKPVLLLVKGKISLDGEPVKANVTAEMISPELKTIIKLNSNSKTGNYLLTLAPGAKYRLTFSYKGLKSQSLIIDAGPIRSFLEKVHQVEFTTPKDTAQPVVSIVTDKPGAPKPSVVPQVRASYASPPSMEELKRDFEPINLVHEKLIRYVHKYGNVRHPDLEFRVQFAAFRKQKNYYFPGLRRFGVIERMKSEDEFTRMTVGGAITTLYRAFILTTKVSNFGYEDAFVVAFYKGRKVQFEELEELGIFSEQGQ